MMRTKEARGIERRNGSMEDEAARAVGFLKEICASRASLGIVLGSGLTDVTKQMRVDAEVAYSQIPGFPVPSVRGHAGRLIFGCVRGLQLIVLSGRSHYYEGYAMAEVTFPIRVLAAMGIKDLLLTNAAGGINRRLLAGDLMLIRDHINFMGVNPLRGDNNAEMNQFVDLTQVYDPTLSGMVEQAAREAKVKLKNGVYLAVSGPSYETPAEIRAFERMGADAVGMSTVPEAIIARQCGLRVAGISCITNMAAGRARGPIKHSEVLAAGKLMTAQIAALLKAFAGSYTRAEEARKRGREAAALG